MEINPTHFVRGVFPTFYLDVGAYEALVEKSELLEDIREAEAEIKAGKGIPHSKVKADLLARFK